MKTHINNNIWNIFVICLCLNNFVLFIFSNGEYVKQENLSILCRSYILIFGLMTIVEVVRNNSNICKNKKSITLLLMIFFAYISYVLNPTGNIYEWLIKLIGYIEIPIFIILIESSKNIKINFNFVRFYIITFTLMIYFKFLLVPNYYIDGALTLGLSNPNQTGQYLILFLCQILIYYFYTNEKKWKWIMLVCGVIISIFIILTKSRICTCTIIIFVMILLCNNWKKIQLNTIMIYFFVISPIIIIFIYQVIFNSNFMMQTEIFGKPLSSGRNYIFDQALSCLKTNILFGNYAYARFENLHNVLLTVLVSCGLFGLILFVIFYSSAYCKIYELSKKSWYKNNVLICLFALYINGLAESAIYISGIMYAGMFIVIYIFAFNDESRRTYQK